MKNIYCKQKFCYNWELFRRGCIKHLPIATCRRIFPPHCAWELMLWRPLHCTGDKNSSGKLQILEHIEMGLDEGEESVESRFEELCLDLNLDRTTKEESWQNYKRIKTNFSLEVKILSPVTILNSFHVKHHILWAQSSTLILLVCLNTYVE